LGQFVGQRVFNALQKGCLRWTEYLCQLLPH
jgi:hypothetical protein